MGYFSYPVDPIIVGIEFGKNLSKPQFQVWENALTPAAIPLTERPWHLACQWKDKNTSPTRKREIAIISLNDYNALKNKPKKLVEHIHYVVEQTEWRSPKEIDHELRAI